MIRKDGWDEQLQGSILCVQPEQRPRESRVGGWGEWWVGHFHQNLRGMEGEKVQAKDRVRSWKAVRIPRLRNSDSLLQARRYHGWVLSQGENITNCAPRIYYHNTME